MCILRYRPTCAPSGPMSTALLWYSPGARRSKTGTMIVIFLSAATRAIAVVDGPGIGSARSNSPASSCWQKYCVRKSSGRHTRRAPWSAATPASLAALRTFSSASGVGDIWMSPTAYFLLVVTAVKVLELRGRSKRRAGHAGQPRQGRRGSPLPTAPREQRNRVGPTYSFGAAFKTAFFAAFLGAFGFGGAAFSARRVSMRRVRNRATGAYWAADSMSNRRAYPSG